jgi:CobQ-like glutamine amidotransferase family enzyme
MDFDFGRKGDFIATTFFGPILAKNPVVLDQILIACGGQAAVWPEEMKSWVDQVKRLHI